ncbi:inhibitor of the pro-sigma K processing machinery [Aneurinibacillus soli]|uniref:Sigma-K factor-processing regulatory protein BofA n=1 Tax=Aneurinibacillus soli TaxID=1500254 RepID=A0A0U5B5V0_9BACL|nr:pro-sigmaK processing inhibitor BofA family protein [Aneurinibacillus soli]PYE57824.1 inhibitor of the pro-sigma K processing machinery [Aneurinibacillus soli]BAU26221.1 Sigma-K factor-processing regulatory protein BofA [Aneurinibacillus soli]
MNGWTIGVAVVIAISVFLLMNQASWRPVKWIGWGLGNLVVGSIMLFLFNLAGESTSFQLPVNPVTVTITGFLGVPGLATLVVIKQFLL